MLRAHFSVKVDMLPWTKKWLYPLLLFIQFFKLFFSASSTNAFVCSFGGYWCIVPIILGKLFSKPVYIILHGTDCCAAPKIGYGVLRKPLLKAICQFCYQNATGLIPVSDSLIISSDSYSHNFIGNQGVKTHFPDLQTQFKTIPNGIDTDFWNFDSSKTRNNQFVTVLAEGQFLRRDGELLLNLFRNNQNLKLVVVGTVPKGISVPKHVTVVDWTTTKDLRKHFQQSSYYIQLSLYEGFGCAMAEAMACGCIPIGTNVNAIPEIIGDTGLILNERNESRIAQSLAKLSSAKISTEQRLAARNRIISNYSLDLREQQLVRLIEGNE